MVCLINFCIGELQHHYLSLPTGEVRCEVVDITPHWTRFSRSSPHPQKHQTPRHIISRHTVEDSFCQNLHIHIHIHIAYPISHIPIRILPLPCRSGRRRRHHSKKGCVHGPTPTCLSPFDLSVFFSTPSVLLQANQPQIFAVSPSLPADFRLHSVADTIFWILDSSIVASVYLLVSRRACSSADTTEGQIVGGAFKVSSIHSSINGGDEAQHTGKKHLPLDLTQLDPDTSPHIQSRQLRWLGRLSLFDTK
jgi:hypothetical protein